MFIFKKERLDQAAIYQWLLDLRARAFVPCSGYSVSAVLRTGADCYFAGVNVENTDHRLAVHAEEAALAALVTAIGPPADVAEGWVMGAPRGNQPGDGSVFADRAGSCCGKCRQQLAGFAAPAVKIHSISLNGAVTTTTVGDFLPAAFSFRDYRPQAPRTSSGSAAPLMKNPADAVVRRAVQSEEDIRNWLRVLQPVDAASGIGQAVVLRLTAGGYAAGVRVEEAAYLDTGAAQAAIAAAACVFGAPTPTTDFVAEVWAYTSTGAGQPVAAAGSFGGLDLSSLQILAPFAKAEVPVHFLDAQGGTFHAATLGTAAVFAPAIGKPFHAA